VCSVLSAGVPCFPFLSSPKMMRRFFGKSKPKGPQPTLDDASKSIEKRGESIDSKIKKLDDELMRYKAQMAKMKPGPAKNSIQQRALRVLKQKKLYEKQRDQVYNQQFNIDQTKFAQDSVKDTVTTVAAMKVASKELKVSMKEINIDEVEDLHDDMSDLIEDNDEIQDVLGRQYGVPEEVDEEDLMAELDSLETDVAQEEEVPNYLVSAASAANQKELGPPVPADRKQQEEVDEYGLPRVPVKVGV